MQIAIGIVLIIASIFLIVAVLMQEGKSHNLSGAIAGGADTFFGKEKGSILSNKLSKLTSVVAIVFVLLVLVSYFMQDTIDLSDLTASIPADEIQLADDVTVESTDEHDHADDTVVEGEGATEGEVTEP